MKYIQIVDGVEHEMTSDEIAELEAVKAAAQAEIHQITPPALRPKTTKSTLAARTLNDDEARIIKEGIKAKGDKLEMFFEAITDIEHDHPLFPELKAGIAEALGEERAEALLAPSL